MSEQPTPPIDAEVTDSNSVAERQVALGEAWARIYANPDEPTTTGADMILRNPTVYLHDVNPHKLPEAQQAEWLKILDFSTRLADVADTETASWTAQTHGLERIQTLVHAGRINPDFRGSVSDVMRMASKVFAESVELMPGRTANYQANLDSADLSLQKHQPQL